MIEVINSDNIRVATVDDFVEAREEAMLYQLETGDERVMFYRENGGHKLCLPWAKGW